MKLVKKSIAILPSLLFIASSAFGQRSLSIASDLAVQRNFEKTQRYAVLGHTTQAIINVNPREGFYGWFSFFMPGRFENKLTATGKLVMTIPPSVDYTNKARMRLRQVSLGWRRYVKGNAETETGWNLYVGAGFGLIFGDIENTHSVPIDTVVYHVPVKSGPAKFKRLSMDLSLGFEIPLPGDLYFYTEGRVWVPTTSYPSKYLFINENAPFMAMLGAGVRVIF